MVLYLLPILWKLISGYSQVQQIMMYRWTMIPQVCNIPAYKQNIALYTPRVIAYHDSMKSQTRNTTNITPMISRYTLRFLIAYHGPVYIPNA